MAHKKKFTRENVLNESQCGGNYRFYDKDGNTIYAGRTAGNKGKYGMKHRLSSYYQKDDFGEKHGGTDAGHPTKKKLRKHIDTYSSTCEPSKKKRRAKEAKQKQGLRFNFR